MAVTLVKRRLHNQGEIGKDASFAIDFEVHMQAGDGVVTALNASDLPVKGDTYNFNGETHPAAHTIKRARMLKTSPSKVIALVTCEFEKKQNEPDEPDGGGNPTTDPLEVQYRVTPGFRVVSTPVRNAEFINYYDQDGVLLTPSGATMIPGTFSPIRNSCWVPYVPIPETPKGFPTLTIEGYYRHWNSNFDTGIHTVNNASYQIHFIDGSGHTIYNRVFLAEELYLHNVTAEQRQFGNKLYYWVTVELWIGDFYLDIADVGVTELLMSSGGSSSGLRPILNSNGDPIQEPVPLNGGGQAIVNPSGTGADTVYLRWRSIPSSDFTLLGQLVP